MVTWRRLLRAGSDVVAFTLLAFVIPFGLLDLWFHQPSGRAPWATTASTVLLLVAGLAWGLVVFSLLRGVWAHLHHRGSFDSRLNRFAARIAVAVSLTFGFASQAGAATSVAQGSAHHVAVSSPTPGTPEMTTTSPDTTYTVRDGDCLWSIAQQFYGDGRSFRRILDANFGHVFGRGERFDNPRIIRTGWVLTIPMLVSPSPRQGTTPKASVLPRKNNSSPREFTTTVVTHHSVSTTSPHATTSTVTVAAASPKTLRPLVGAISPQPDDDHLLQTVGALGLGLVAGAFAARRRRALVDDEETPPKSAELEAALRLGDLVLQGGLVDAVLAELKDRGHLLTPSANVHEACDKELDGEKQSHVALLLGQRDQHSDIALVKPGTRVTVTGSHRGGLVRLQRLLATTWGDELGGVPTSSATFAADHVALKDPRTLLYFGNVGDLDPNVAEQSVVVTSEPGGSLVIEVEEHLTHVGTEPPLSTLSIAKDLAAEAAVLGELEEPLQECPASKSTSPMVRLLTPVPRIDGLAVDLDRKRARRAVELASYLSLNRTHLVTGGQLRTELLGDAENDGSTKSLSNTVSALRRSLGGDIEGSPHLPPATRSGCYALAPSVTSDYEQALQFLAGAELTSGDEALALVRAACDLVEGRPLSSCVLGFDWFFRDGHERVLARALSKGVAQVLDHAIAEGHLDLARRLIEQASLVNPYSETLARGAMSVAAATNDVDQLQQEWNGHLRRLDDLEPGLSPSATTEAHFWRLHGVCAGTLSP